MANNNGLAAKAGCCRKDFGLSATENLSAAPKEEMPMPAHLVCPCYRPKGLAA